MQVDSLGWGWSLVSHCALGSKSPSKQVCYEALPPPPPRQATPINHLSLLPFPNPYYNFPCCVMAFNFTKV